jgi:hypothetical protein
MQHKILSTITVFLLLLTVASCNKNIDNEKPVILNATLNGENVNPVVLNGENAVLKAIFKDNEALGEYKVDIHDAFDGHTHGKTAATPWSTVIINKIEGKEHNLELPINIPTDAAAGPYHLILYCIDKEGNEADFVEIDFMLKNTSDTIAPQLTIIEPSNNFSISKGTPINVSGTATDNLQLRKIEIKARKKNASNFLFNETINLAGSTQNFQQQIATSGLSWTTGEYELIFVLYDNVYNTKTNIILFNLN